MLIGEIMELLETLQLYKLGIAVVVGMLLLIYILKKIPLGCYLGFHRWGKKHNPTAGHYNTYPSIHRKCSQCPAWESKEELSKYK